MQKAQADKRFTMTVTADHAVQLVLENEFTEADIDALVAAENALRANIPPQRADCPN